ncbi:hypothetical protein IG631_11013 [Alternaria alternata]|nr:hypothetical protein IG631_11013 [Alternaria alternata]
MGESVKTTLLQSSWSPNPDALYCEQYLQVDRSFNDIPSLVVSDQTHRVIWSLKEDADHAKKDTTCPSCKAFLDIVETEDIGTKDITLWFEFEEAILSGFKGSVNPYLLQRSEYPLRLRNDPPASTKAANLPIETIKAWIRTCELSHISCNAQETTMSLYLVDVVAECIKFMPTARTNYVALSYVWGNVECTKLNRENLNALQAAGSLSSESDIAIIPHTIRDAMRLTAELDIRYLWVDSLCLRQDDFLLSRYLNQMHNIYHNAYLTVVVADEDNADGGITGYETSSTGRQFADQVVNYPNYVLGLSRKTSPDRLELPWFSRGWTLQEGFFSRRALVISDRIQFRCAESYSREGTIVGHNAFLPSKVMRTILESICQSPTDVHSMGSWSSRLSSFNRWQTYSKLVQTFSSREFSYDNDIMKAFSGVEFNIRRRNLSPRHDGSPAIPSWSWLAWQHKAEPELSELSEHFSLEEWDHFIDLDLPTIIQAQCSTCIQTHKMEMRRCSNRAALERIDPDRLDPYLYIKAQRAHFSLLEYSEGDEKEGVLVRLGDVKNEDEEPNAVGMIVFDIWPPEQSLDRDGVFYFIGMFCQDDIYEVLQVKALCIKPVGNRPFVFERLGVVEIRKDEWDSIAWYDESIILG